MWKKVVGPTALISLLWLAVGGATICYVNWLYTSHADELAETFTGIQAADAMQDSLWRLQATVMEVAESADSHTQIEVAELEEAFERQLAQAETGSLTPEGQLLLKTIREQFEQYQDCVRRRLKAGTVGEAAYPARAETARLSHAVAGSCKRLLEINEQLIAESTAQRSRLRVSFDLVMLSLWIVGPVLGLLGGLYVARGLSRSISQISISLRDAADGLEHEVGRIDLQPSDDLPALHRQVQLVSSRIRQVVDQLQEARRETMLADRLAAVGELAAGVAHELRNPLTSVKLLIQTAAQRSANRPLSEKQLRVVQEEIVRMENTIQGLLDFARPPAIHDIRHDLRDTLRRALNLVEGRAKQQAVDILEELPTGPVIVNGDPEQLHQVFVNLLLNAVESMPQGGPLRVAIQADDQAPGVCRVTVCDSGTGIPPTVMPRLFEPFVTSKERGTGLGLAISRRIVQEHAGRLIAASREGNGSVFTVELPLTAPQAAREVDLSGNVVPNCEAR